MAARSTLSQRRYRVCQGVMENLSLIIWNLWTVVASCRLFNEFAKKTYGYVRVMDTKIDCLL
jgi:hypothetical protein